MVGSRIRRLKGRLLVGLRTLVPRRNRRWRVPFRQWAEANLKTVLESEGGEARLDAVVSELARRLTPILVRLSEGLYELRRDTSDWSHQDDLGG